MPDLDVGVGVLGPGCDIDPDPQAVLGPEEPSSPDTAGHDSGLVFVSAGVATGGADTDKAEDRPPIENVPPQFGLDGPGDFVLVAQRRDAADGDPRVGPQRSIAAHGIGFESETEDESLGEGMEREQFESALPIVELPSQRIVVTPHHRFEELSGIRCHGVVAGVPNRLKREPAVVGVALEEAIQRSLAELELAIRAEVGELPTQKEITLTESEPDALVEDDAFEVEGVVPVV